jgi:hypothetical protein
MWGKAGQRNLPGEGIAATLPALLLGVLGSGAQKTLMHYAARHDMIEGSISPFSAQIVRS